MKNVIIIFTIIFIWYSIGIFGCILLTMDEIKDTEYNDNTKIITPEVFLHSCLGILVPILYIIIKIGKSKIISKLDKKLYKFLYNIVNKDK